MRRLLCSIALIAAIALAGCAAPSPENDGAPPTGVVTQTPEATETPESTTTTPPPGGSSLTSPTGTGISDAAALTREKCSTCHEIERVKNAEGRDKAEWQSTIERMRRNGAQLTDPEAKQIADFLAAGGAAQL